MIRTARDLAATAEQLQACAGQGDAIDRLLAKHPNASAQLLEQLSHSSDRATRKAVTLHPNTPKDALLKLAPQFPGDFFQNPAFDWLLLEHPNLMFDIGGGVLKNVLKRAECPQSFMAWAAAHGSEQERLAVAMNPQALADVLQAIERKGGKAAQAAQQHANHPLASGEGDLESAFRKAVEQAIAEEFDAIQSTTLVRDLPTLAQWPALSVAKRLESSLLMGDCAAIAAHPGAPSALAEPILNALAASAHEGARLEVADQPGAPAAILAKLADDSDKEVRRAARAKRRAVETDIHTKLAFDSSCDGRFAFLCKSDTPAAVVAQRINSACEDAHRLVFDCRRSSWWIGSVAKLKAKDADLIQACNAGNVLFLPDQVADKACRKTELVWRLLGLSHRLASPEDLAKRSRSTEWVERMAVARNPNTPPNIIEALRKDPHRLVARQAEATAALKSGATARQAQLLQEMPSDSGDQMVANEAGQRLGKRYQSDFWDLWGSYGGLYFSRWARCMAPGLWLMGLSAATQARLEAELPSLLKQAMSDYWADPSIPLAEINEPARLLVLRLLSQRPMTKELQDRLRRLAKDSLSVAYNPSTPTPILAALAGHSVEAVRRSVAKNPSTPVEILAKLGRDSKSWVRSGVFANPATPAATLATLADDADVRLHADPTPTSAPPIADLAALSSDPSEGVRYGVAQNPATPVDLLTKLAGDPDCWVRHAVAGNPATPSDTRLAALATLAADSVDRDCVTVARKIATDTATPGDILAKLAAHSCDWVRTFVTENTATPASVLAAMDRDPAENVRKGLAKNPSTPATVLAQLAGVTGADVRAAVAANGATPSAALAKLAGDPASDVRRNVAKNPATLLTTLVQLVRDLDSAVRAAVAANPAIPADILGTLAVDSDLDVRSKAAGNPATPAPALAILASDAAWRVRWAVAANPASPSSTLVTLAGDLNWRVCLAAVRNPNASAEMLLVPTADTDADTRRAGARRCAELRSALATESPTPEQSAVIQSWIAELQAGLAESVVLKDVSDSEFRLAFDALGLMPAEGDKRAIAKAVKSKDWLERAAVTYAPGIQPSLLKVLLEDPVEAVRQCAVARLRVA